MTVPRRIVAGILIQALFAVGLGVEAQQTRVYRVGVVLHGGPYTTAVDGLRDGLRESGFEEGKQFVFHVRDTKGDLKSVEAAAKSLEAEKVDMIYTLATSVTLAVKRATKTVPILFYAGSDPVALGLVESYRKPGGRLTGIHSQLADATARRLQLLKEMVPKARRVVTFYNPLNPVAQEAIKLAREAARQLKVELIERPVASVDDLRAGLSGLRPGEADAYLYVADAMMMSQAELIIDTVRTKRLPAIFADKDSAAKGALASYGVSYYAAGHRSAKYAQRLLLGADPGSLPVEQIDRLHLAINLKAAKALGLTIPSAVLAQADEVIE